RGRAALPRVLQVGRARTHGDEEVAVVDAARVDLDAGDVGRIAVESAELERPQLLERDGDQVRAPSFRSASRAASRSSKGTTRSANSCPCSAPLPAMTTTSPSRADSTA